MHALMRGVNLPHVGRLPSLPPSSASQLRLAILLKKKKNVFRKKIFNMHKTEPFS